MSHLITSDKEPTIASQSTEDRNARKLRKRPTDEDYAQLKPIIFDKENNQVYERESLLGRGGFSRVYQVRDKGNVRENNEAVLWADKVVSLEMLKRSTNAYQKVKKEISLHRDMSHENIVRLVNDFEDENYIHIILEHCGMGTLNDVLRVRKTISETEARYYMEQVLRGVQFIHNEGLLHCDIKLANIMLSRDMVVKIGDFGLACRIGDSQPSGLKGTPNYMAPELLDSQSNSEASDVWACGIILYSLICGGRPPFESQTVEETYYKIKTGDYLKPVDSSLKAVQIIDSILTKNVMQRGHLDVKKSLDGYYLLTHPFFTESFMPKKLPTCAAFTDGWKLDFFDGAMPSGSPPPDEPYRMFSIPPSSPEDFTDREEAMMTEAVNEAELIIVDQGPPLVGSRQDPRGGILPQKETAKRFLDRVVQNLQKCQSICSNNGGSDFKIIPVFVKRWVSTNYGFLFELSDNSTGALFEDRSRIAVKGEIVEAIDHMNNKMYYPIREAIADPGTLAQVKFLDGMSETMKTNIPDNTSSLDFSPYEVAQTNGQNKNIQIKRWNWNEAEGCAVMELSNHVVQFEVNQGTLRAIVWEVEKPRQMFLTVVDVGNNDVSTYSFHSFFMMGCPRNLRPLMDHALQEITQMLRKRASIINYVP